VQSGDGRLVTPEAVVLQFETAGLGSRILARALDTVIQVAFLLALLLVLALFRAASGAATGTAFLIIFLFGLFLDLFVYSAFLETVWRGQTIGKRALGLRVVTREGAPIHFRHAAIRSALWLVDGLLFAGPTIGVGTMLLTRQSLRTGDMVAGTIVVRERSGARAPTAVTFAVPPGCEPYVASIDVGGLTAELYEAVRSFLLRGGSLAPQVRLPLAVSFARPVAARIRHNPPAWVGPELFLACVAAAYQRRYGAPAPAPVSNGWGPPTSGAAPPGWYPPPVPQPSNPLPTPVPDGGGFTAPS
jgi:uncharacterized RDD family membrane protein YckC